MCVLGGGGGVNLNTFKKELRILHYKYLTYSAYKKKPLHFWKICQNYISKYLEDFFMSIDAQ